MLNPWITIWREPRATVRRMVHHTTPAMVLLLTMLGGISEALNRAATKNLGDRYSLLAIFLMVLLLGAIGGIVSLYLGSWLLAWSGRRMGGLADAGRIRIAIAWSQVPMVWSMLLAIVQVLLIGDEMFSSFTPRVDSSLRLLVAYSVISVIQLVLAIWSIVIYLKCLGEVQGFSAWKALACSFHAFSIIIIAILVVVAILFLIGLIFK